MSSLVLCCSCSTLTLPKAPACAATTTRWSSLVFDGRPASIFLASTSADLLRKWRGCVGSELECRWSFVGGRRVTFLNKVTGIAYRRKGFRGPSAFWLTNSQIATSAFTWGTVAVLPFYTLMVVAPNAAFTRKTMESTAPYVALGLLYAYLLYLSWTPDTLRSMFASKYWLPELAGIAKMFSNEITVASVWIHLLAVDLFAARQVFLDGLENKVETRHSVSLCLLFCPIGIFTHAVTKFLTKTN